MRTRYRNITPLFLLPFSLLLCLCQTTIATAQDEKPRLLILTDIGGDPDDIQSLRRLLVYANEFRIEGIIASASLNKKLRRPGFDGYFVNDSIVHLAINDYEKVRGQLAKHAVGYPLADALRAGAKAGQRDRVAAIGKSTEGSSHIIKAVDASDETLNVVIWGGSHDLGQALLDVKSSRTAAETAAFVSKLFVYGIGDQHTKSPGEPGSIRWIMENFPALRCIQSGSFRGMYQNDSAGNDHPDLPLVREGIEKLNNTQWIVDNVNTWGALGAGYPADVRQNPPTPRNTTGVKEGDTPAWFYFLRNGLSDAAFPEWGSWGGRFIHVVHHYFITAQDNHWSATRDAGVRERWTVARWREDYQNDFAARMRWCTRGVDEANHHPVAVIDSDSSMDVIFRNAKPGERIKLDASNSTDPDGDELSFNWWIYQEASSTPAFVKEPSRPKVQLIIPKLTRPGEVHVVLEVKDSGTPQLTAYRRVIVTVSGN